MQPVEMGKPIEKRSYSKEEVPTSHDFSGGSSSATLAVGMLGGQVHLIDTNTKEITKCYNSGEVR